jgi:lipopolysaccharide export LptBFGC system permease protein LptF
MPKRRFAKEEGVDVRSMTWVIILFSAFMAYRLYESLKHNGTDVPWPIIVGVWFGGFVVLSLIWLMRKKT